MAEQQESKPRKTAQQLKSQLANTVKRGDLEEIKKIVNELGVENGERAELLNCRFDRDFTLLHIAAEHNHVPIINWLLSDRKGEGQSLGFNKVLARGIDEWGTALHAALGKGNIEAIHAIVNGLRVDNGERKEMLNAVDGNGQTILHLAVLFKHRPIIKWILSEEGGRAVGFNSVLSRTKDGETALHIAAWKGNLAFFLAIVDGLRVDNGEREEMLNASDDDGRNVLHIAVDYHCEEIIRWILSEEGGRAAGFDSVLAKTMNEMRTALHFAAQYSSPDTTSALLSHCTNEERMNLFLAADKYGWTALHYAARFDSANVITHLLSYPECGLIVNMKDNRGMTVLHRAIIGGIDEESRSEWGWDFHPDGEVVRSLLGLNGDSSSSSSSSSSAEALIDPNIGLGLL